MRSSVQTSKITANIHLRSYHIFPFFRCLYSVSFRQRKWLAFCKFLSSYIFIFDALTHFYLSGIRGGGSPLQSNNSWIIQCLLRHGTLLPLIAFGSLPALAFRCFFTPDLLRASIAVPFVLWFWIKSLAAFSANFSVVLTCYFGIKFLICGQNGILEIIAVNTGLTDKLNTFVSISVI